MPTEDIFIGYALGRHCPIFVSTSMDASLHSKLWAWLLSIEGKMEQDESDDTI